MRIFEFIICFFIICIALNNPFLSNKVYLIIPILAMLYLITKKINIKRFKDFLKSIIFIFIFYIVYSYTLFYYDLYSINTLIIHSCLPLGLFIIGYVFMISKDSNKITKMIAGISFSSCIYVFLCLLLTLKRYGINNEAGRVVVNIWDANQVLNVTNITAFLVLGSCLIGVLIARNNKKSKLLMCMAIVEFIVAISFAIFTGGRTAMMLTPFMLILTYIIVPDKFSKKIKYLLAVVIIVFLGIYIYNCNIFNIKEIIQSGALWKRLNTENILYDTRFNIWNEVIHGMIYYPFGGKQIQTSLSYIHNIFLDTIYYGGVQSCIFLVLFMIQYFYKTIIIILKDNNKTLCAILSAFSIGSLVYFSFEPVLQGVLNMFSIFAFMFGMISSYFYKLKNESENNLSKISNT